jgi:hypothetical protein
LPPVIDGIDAVGDDSGRSSTGGALVEVTLSTAAEPLMLIDGPCCGDAPTDSGSTLGDNRSRSDELPGLASPAGAIRSSREGVDDVDV